MSYFVLQVNGKIRLDLVSNPIDPKLSTSFLQLSHILRHRHNSLLFLENKQLKIDLLINI